jgi:hypothetical protein
MIKALFWVLVILGSPVLICYLVIDVFGIDVKVEPVPRIVVVREGNYECISLDNRKPTCHRLEK